jgi:hypothetical protein
MSLEFAQRMAVALLARGLQRQAEGDPDDFPRQFQIVMTLARTLRNGSIIASYQMGVEIEREALVALDQWLAAIPLRSERLKKAIAMTAAIEPAAPFDPTPHFLSERHVIREGMKAPGQWIPQLVAGTGGAPETASTEADLVTLAWAVPWERERTRRLAGLGFETGPPNNYRVVIGRPGAGLLFARARSPYELIENERLLSTHRRAALLKVALRAYRSSEGKYPYTLDELTHTGYLGRMPDDPFRENSSFGYRLAGDADVLANTARTGPVIQGNLQVGRSDGGTLISYTVPKGDPILWSIGPDRIDQEGKSLPIMMLIGQTRPVDIVYLVPSGPEGPPGSP